MPFRPTKIPQPPASEPSRPELKPKPGPQDLERIDAFLGDFLLPMLADGQIDAEEETPLVVAYHAYGIDAFDPWHVLGRANDRIQFGVPGHSRSFVKAWARIQLYAERMTRNDFLRTRDWLENEGRRAGLANLSLPDADPGTVFSALSIDRTCISRFQKLIATMRASNLPIAPCEVQPRTEGLAEGLEEPARAMATEGPDEAPAEEAARGDATTGTDTTTSTSGEAAGVPEAAGSPGAPDTAEAAAEGTSEGETPAPEDVPAAVEAGSPPAARPAPPAVPDLVEVRIPDSVAESIPVLAERLRAGAADILAAFTQILEGPPDGLSGFLFDDCRSGPGNQAVIIDSLPDDNLWFLGDLHGDLLALEAALSHITQAQAGSFPSLVLLGDLFDDGDHSYEVVLRVLELVVEHPGRIAVLAGNHDEALDYDPVSGMFRSSVSPSDFTDWLNVHAPGNATVRGVGEAVVKLFAQAPRAFFFPDGLLAAHGGVPLSDLWESLRSPADLDRMECLQDFVWTRAHPRARRKIPNRTTRGCEFGVEDFAGFCQAASRALGGHPVERMIRGHDHVEERYQLYPRYESHPLLTINAMSRRLAREVFGPYARVPVVARYRPGALPQVHRLVMDEDAIRRVYPEPVEAEEEAAEARTETQPEIEGSPDNRPPRALDSALPDGR